MKPEKFFDRLWEDYIRIAPQAATVKDLVLAKGENPANDHVAFRTFDVEPINLETLEKQLFELGYRRYEPYRFEEKKLRAYGYLHEGGFPRIFLSELETQRFSPALQGVVQALCHEIDRSAVQTPAVFYSGRLWSAIPYTTYERLKSESEYAAWVAALGLRANHFTISINSLKKFETISHFADFLEESGFELNKSGGRIKGSPAVFLEQGSTMADRVSVEFGNGELHEIPTCYYEFAMRYPDATGKLYDGFVAASADRIFESTDNR